METSPNWNVEIIPGSRRAKRIVGAVIDFARFPRSDGYPSDHRHVTEPVEPAEVQDTVAVDDIIET